MRRAGVHERFHIPSQNIHNTRDTPHVSRVFSHHEISSLFRNVQNIINNMMMGVPLNVFVGTMREAVYYNDII